MSVIADHLKLGTLPLQDYGYVEEGVPLHQRTTLYAVRVKERPSPLGSKGQGPVGHYVPDENSGGDVLGSVHWPAESPDQRPTGAWAFGWGVRVDYGAGPVVTPGMRGNGGAGAVVTPGIS